MRHLRNQGMETLNGERARAERGDARTVEGREPREKGRGGDGEGDTLAWSSEGPRTTKASGGKSCCQCYLFRTMQMMRLILLDHLCERIE